MAEYGLEHEEEYFPPDFKEYMDRELKWSRLEISGRPDDFDVTCPSYSDDKCWQRIKWVFWSRRPDRPLYPDNFVDSIPDACPSPEVVRENIRHALHKMISDLCLADTLVQFWAPTKTLEGRTFLTIQYQPFALNSKAEKQLGLCEYRMKVCHNFFSADAHSGEEQLGLPGRVFLHELPEFNPDVQDYSLKEYPQRDLALRCSITGYCALPVFASSSHTCVGVLEILSLSSAYFPMHSGHFCGHLYDIFQEFSLTCFIECEASAMPIEDEDKDEDEHQALVVAFKELEMLLESVCEIHKLPLAMTWVPCDTCNHLLGGQHLFEDEEFFGLKDDYPFQEELKAMLKTCHLRKGQVTGRILPFTNLLYCTDVKQLSITEHPFVACVRHLELSGCFTMCLQNSCTGSELYVLDFFLPAISKDDENILTRLSLILRTMKENFKSFKLACGQEFGGGLSVEVIDFPNGQRSHSVSMLQLSQPDQPSMDAVNNRMNVISEAQNYSLPNFAQNGKVVTQLDSSNQPSMDSSNNGQNVITAERNSIVGTSAEEGKRKTQKRERSKTGVKIEVPLEDILKCSGMSRDNAAIKLKVSKSTLKRVCRGHGIPRWPPRIKETVHSSQPLPVKNQEQPSQLTSDLPLNQASASVVHIKPPVQDVDQVTIRAKYGNDTIKFFLSLSSRLVELHEEVAKRLNLETGSYNVKYKDEEDELILIACDEDLQYCVRYSRSVGKTSIAVQLEPKQTP